MRNIRWGVLSTARIGAGQVIPAIRKADNATLVAVASRSEQTASEFAKKHGIPKAYGSYDALIQDPDIDAVYIPLPNHLHAKWSIKAARQGKHILCEKPATLTASQLKEVLTACKEHNVLFEEAFMYQHHDQWKRVHQLIAEGAIGELRIVKSSFSFPLTDQADVRLDPTMGGGSLYDVGCYCVHAIRTFADGSEIVEVKADAMFSDDGIVDRTMVGTMRFANGLLGHFDCSFEVVDREEVEIVGTKGVIRLPYPFRPDKGEPKLLIQAGQSQDTDSLSERTETLPATLMYQRQIENFGDAVINGRPETLTNKVEHSLLNMQIIDLLYEAAGRRPLDR